MLCHGYGFVAFADTPEGLRAAYMVVDAMRDATYDNVRYKCELSRKLQMKVSGFTPEPYQQQQQQPYPHHMQGGDVGYGYSPPTPTSGSAMPHAAAQHAVPASAIGKGQSREFHRALGSKFAGGYDPPYNPSQQQQQQQQQSRYSRPQSHYRPQSQPQPQPQHYASFPGGSASIPSSYQVFPPHPPYAQVGGSRPAMGTHFYSFPSRDRYGNASNIHQFRDTPSIPVIPVDAAALPHLAHVNVPASQRTYHQSAHGTTDGADARLSSPHAGPVKDYPAPDASGGLSLAIAMGGLSLNPVSSEEPYADREAACFFSKNFPSSARRDATMMDRSVTYGATSIAAAGIDSAGDSLVNLISCDSASPQRFNSLLPTDSGANYPRRMFASDLSVHSVVTEGDLYRSNSSEGKASVFYGVVASPVTTTCTTNTLSSPLISSNTSVSDALNTFTNSERTKEISIGAFESFTAVARTAAEVLEDDSDETFVQREQSHN